MKILCLPNIQNVGILAPFRSKILRIFLWPIKMIFLQKSTLKNKNVKNMKFPPFMSKMVIAL